MGQAIFAVAAAAQTPVTLYQSLAGDYDHVVTGGSLRNAPNSGPGANPCSVVATGTATVPPIPAGSSLVAAYLYWAGSGGTPDNTVSFAGRTVTASRTFSDTYTAGSTFRFFGGFADVTGLVTATGGQSFTFGGLTVATGSPYCGSQAVLASWALVLVYENAAEPLRVVNIFDGFRIFRGGSITLTPSTSSFRPTATANTRW